MTSKESEDKCFSFLWKLENITYCLQKNEQRIRSPSFVVDAIEGTKWNLSLYPRGQRNKNYVGFYLHRESDCKGANKVYIRYEMAFIANDGSVLESFDEEKWYFLKGTGYGLEEFVLREEVFVSKRLAFLPQDTLRTRCRIWKIDGMMEKDIRCTARTCFEIEKRSFLWDVKHFSTFEAGKKCTYQLQSKENGAPLVSVDLLLTKTLDSEEMIQFELFLKDYTIKFSTLSLFLITDSGVRVECAREELWFDDPAEGKELIFAYTKKKLSEQKSEYLPKDTLSLLWEWAFNRGVESKESEDYQYGCIYPEVKISNAQEIKNDNTNALNYLMDNVKSLYNEHFLSDVKLKTNTSVFPAHKFILSASSSVFKRMFSSDMKEQNSDCVNIEDLSDDTIRQMLVFIYTTCVEDLTCERASHLYEAADKYAILSLKNVCSSFLKENISPSNACEVLLLADMHGDDDFKCIVQDYILKNGKQIINSEEWKVLMQTNSKLAAETVCLLFK